MKNSIFWMMMIGIFLFIACRKEITITKKPELLLKENFRVQIIKNSRIKYNRIFITGRRKEVLLFGRKE